MPNVHGENAHYFYQNGKLSRLQRQGASYTIFRQESRPLALRPDSLETDVLVTTPSNTVIASTLHTSVFTYDAYGYNPDIPTDGHLLGFNGEPRIDARGYFLGNGYRTYNPILRRFNSPDDESPFGAGGISAYAYCADDPVNLIDPSGRFPNLINPSGFFSKWAGMRPVAKPIALKHNVSAKTTSSNVQQQRSRDPSKSSINNPFLAQNPTVKARTHTPYSTRQNTASNPMTGSPTLPVQQLPQQHISQRSGVSRGKILDNLKAATSKLPPDSNSGFMSHNVKMTLTLIAGSGVAAGLGYGIYAIVKKVREEPYYGAS